MDKRNPVSDVIRSDGVVLSAKITVEGWIFCIIRVNGRPFFQATVYRNSDRYTSPPCHIKAQAKRIAGGVFSEKREKVPTS